MAENHDIEVSHGRGGAGNISVDPTQYTDGEIVREEVAGVGEDGPFSVGRGGVANIKDVNKEGIPRTDHEIIPPAATKYRFKGVGRWGRGGAGNLSDEHAEVPQGLGGKLVDMIRRKIAPEKQARIEAKRKERKDALET